MHKKELLIPGWLDLWPPGPPAPGVWTVYLIRCQNGSLYCGIAKSALQRWQAHVAGQGARYTRSFPPQEMRLVWTGLSHTQAARCEYLIKQWPRARKAQLWACLDVFQAA
ncbi:putative endonuclease [Neisseria sp. HSC-16F19]|nr:GIY-YIG nuclease family protein [Neisseria sp. HSC-16F19]MCP2041082.1 putative endonuclease [Neisseria sp. HSC-16F19]